VALAVLASGCTGRRGKGAPDAEAEPGESAGAGAGAGADASARPAGEVTSAFVKAWAAADNAHDAGAAAELYAPDTTQQLAGEPVNEGRAAVQKVLEGAFARSKDAKLAIGRVWVGSSVSIVEYVFSGLQTPGDAGVAKRFGVPGVVVLRFDADGLVKTERQYFDLADNLGQVDLKLLPRGFDKVRAAMTAPPSGADVLESKGTPAESRNLDTMNKLYGALDVHAIDDAMALIADDFVLEDFTTPGPQKKADARKRAAAILAAIPDYKVARATIVAAGDDVVVESSVTGTFTAALGAIPPTGKPVLVHQLDVWRVEAGKITRQWAYSNQMEVLAQLGVLQPKSP
jgi:steroid delta-isomerase-like uncharacterized protein